MELTPKQVDTCLSALVFTSNYLVRLIGTSAISDKDTRTKYGNELCEIEELIDILQEKRNKQ